MRQTVFKVFPAWEFEREEKWLNEMAARGFTANLALALLLILVAMVIGFGFMRTLVIMRRIKSDLQLFE